MYYPVTSDESVTLEKMIDLHGLARVLDALATICQEKAEHIEGNWQDARNAGVWSRASVAVNSAAVRAEREGL